MTATAEFFDTYGGPQNWRELGKAELIELLNHYHNEIMDDMIFDPYDVSGEQACLALCRKALDELSDD